MTTKEAFLIFPNQLFEEAADDSGDRHVYLIEDDLFFGQYPFHQKKLMLHRASMQAFYKAKLKTKKRITYLEHSEVPDMEALGVRLKEDGIQHVRLYEPADDWLERRLQKELVRHGIECEMLETPAFLCSRELCEKYFKGKNRYLMHHFYVAERKRLNLLMDGGGPAGGRWSLDQENRKKLPKGEKIVKIAWPKPRPEIDEAGEYIVSRYQKNYGDTREFCYPVTHKDARKLLDDFLKHRFEKYGIYQDAIKSDETFLFHSLISSSLNIGLLTPREVISRAVTFAEANKIPLNSLEGFVRQVVGWREFIRGIYRHAGRKQRTTNYWKHTRKIPESFWKGTTGIEPVDQVIQRVLKTGYCHHIERLMILGNFMLLCEFDPDDVYRWFMELFIDAYDWVMVPNVYGMSQFADGGLMATKPYISSSNYVLKMSDFKKGTWCNIWDGLFWQFIENHRPFFAENPRLKMMTWQLDEMDVSKRKALSGAAERFLKELSLG